MESPTSQLHRLEGVRSDGISTGIATLCLPPGTQPALVNHRLTRELSSASNIRDPRSRRVVQQVLRMLIANVHAGARRSHESDDTGRVLVCGPWV